MKVATTTVLEQQRYSESHRQYLLLAIPLIISNLTQPLLGIVDTAVVGRLPDPSYIGGVAVGALIFNIMYWLFGFLRVSTTGFTAQAHGSKDEKEMMLSLLRPMTMAIIFGLLFIVLQYPILLGALWMVGPSDLVTSHVHTYFSIRIWGAPFALMSYVIIGWLMGLTKVRLSMTVQISMNMLNMLLSVWFVLGMDFGVAGVAIATLISELFSVLLGFVLLIRSKQIAFRKKTILTLFEAAPLLKMLSMNRDLFLRTVCLLTMTTVFTSKGAEMGEVALAANAIILQIHYFMAYFFSGFANASSIMVGRAIGERNQSLFQRACLLSGQWGGIAAVFLTGVILFFGSSLVGFFTILDNVKDVASEHVLWLMAYSIVGYWGLQLEGIFSGATEARSIRNSILFSLLVFFGMLFLTVPVFGNHGVWFAFVMFSFSRSLFLSLYIPNLARTAFKA
ncbi:MATE family efflux transporter [Halalkalibacter urbisdiaboli]|uniref:MATE family efflux transporter n=1 Tax=Halalkalibacter urbisdiaboli TaxID=1960589 RepID=UPI000B44EBA1|nr:MATE family efflux transporter [Halalkalibacter urbisdiaboli]